MITVRPPLRARPALVLGSLALSLGLLSGGGCASQVDVDAVDAALLVTVDGPRWRAAPAGCEGVSESGLVIAACDGEAALGALIDAQGRVRCVDALDLLVAPPRAQAHFDPRAGDPSPQPNRPPPPTWLGGPGYSVP